MPSPRARGAGTVPALGDEHAGDASGSVGHGRRTRSAALLVATALLWPSLRALPARAEGAPAAGARVIEHLASSPRLLDDPGGVRGRLERNGLELQLFYNQVLSSKPHGGRESDARRGADGSYDLIALADAEKLAGWPGLTALLQVKGQYDHSINGDVGALSDPVDDADFDKPIYVDQLWLEQSLAGERLRLRTGFLEVQTLFDRNAFADSEDLYFMATHLDNNGLLPLPNALGAALIWAPRRGIELALGTADADNVAAEAGFDTTFDGLDSLNAYAELDLDAQSLLDGWKLPGRYRVGVFRDGRRRTVFGQSDPATGTPDTERGHWGAYLSFDQQLFEEHSGGRQGLGAFARAGYADEDVSPVAWFWSTGLQYRGLLPGRDADLLGIAVYHDILSDRLEDEAAGATADELGIELYYRIAVLPSLQITPDFQYIADPGTGSGDDAVVLNLRVRMSF